MRFAALAFAALFTIGGAMAHTNVVGVKSLPPLLKQQGRMPLQYGSPSPSASPTASPAVPSPSTPSPATPSPSTPSTPSPSTPSSPSVTPSPGFASSPTPAPTPSPGQSTITVQVPQITFTGTKSASDYTFLAGKSCPLPQPDLNAVAQFECESAQAATNWPADQVTCRATAACVTGRKRSLLQSSPSIDTTATITLKVESAAQLAAAQLAQDALALKLKNDGFAVEKGTTSETIAVPSPACSFKGTYQLVNDARKACPAKKSHYVVYNGGSTSSCKNSTILLRPSGKFNAKRARWALATVGGSTSIVTAGRECPDGEKGMQPAGTTVILGVKTTKWQIVPTSGSCSSVYIKRVSSSASFLSVPTKCTDQKLIFASKDYGTGRQRWRLVKV